MPEQLVRRSRILDSRGRPFLRPAGRPIRARYDAAQTTAENIRHWSYADSLSADSANSPAVRKRLRERARYEVANNGWARSMVETLAHEVIGTGPRIQVRTGSGRADDWIERQFAAWCRRVRLPRKLRTLRKAKATDGEAVALLVNNPRFGDVQLDLRPIEAEMLSTPDIGGFGENRIDGIDLDEQGNPIRYHVLRHHPGGTEWGFDPLEELSPPPLPDEVLHVFREDRPGQHRGIPELTAALPLFSKLRRYTLAVVQSAETAAELTVLLKTATPESAATNFGPSGDTDTEPAAYETFDTFDIERNTVTVLPEGTEPYQFKPEQPSTTHSEFVRITLAEAFACVMLPYAMGAQDSSQENFASGKLTRLGIKRAVEVERSTDWNPEVERLFWSWFAEAKYAMPEQVRAALAARPPAEWVLVVYWDKVQDDIDPGKAATARKTRLESGQTSIPAIYQEEGRDWEEDQKQAARALGIPVAEYRKRLAAKLLGGGGGSAENPSGGDPRPNSDQTDQAGQSDQTDNEEPNDAKATA